MLLPHGLIALSLGTVMFPVLARHYAAGDMPALRATALAAVRGVLFLALPFAALLAILRLPVLRLLYQRGQFDAMSTTLTAEALGFYALGLVAFAAAEILVRAFYAMRDTRTPVYVGIGAVVLNIALGWALLRLRPSLGMLALAFSVANTCEALALLLLLRPRLGRLGRDFWSAAARMGAAALACAATLLTLLWLSRPSLAFLQNGDSYRWPADFVPLAIWLAVASALGVLTYGGVALALRLEEVRTMQARAGSILARVRPKRG
jgi:putative peptidoglycan lipid II flippase